MNNSYRFPNLLHEVLSDAEKCGYSNIVSWLPCGKAFQVHDRDAFEKFLLSRICPRSRKFESFQRQLALYHFESLRRGGPLLRAYCHPLFRRDRPEFCEYILRKAAISKMGLAKEDESTSAEQLVGNALSSFPPTSSTEKGAEDFQIFCKQSEGSKENRECFVISKHQRGICHQSPKDGGPTAPSSCSKSNPITNVLLEERLFDTGVSYFDDGSIVDEIIATFA